MKKVKNNAFFGKKHSKKTLEIIGEKSRAKFTPDFIQKIKDRHQGTKHRDINGYILIKDYNHPNRNSHNDVLEHRYKLSKKIGRSLTKEECVHHINFIKTDNRLKNLYLCSKKENLQCHSSLFKLVEFLLEAKIIRFSKGKYYIKGITQ